MKVSLIIPIFGVERYIGQCVESLFNQTYDDLEFVFVNDCTEDNSMQILEDSINQKYAHLKSRIKILNKEKNEGLPQARRSGVEIASGDYIMHCDSDDWLELNAVEIAVQNAIQNNSDIVYFNYEKVYVDHCEIGREAEFMSPQDYLKAIMQFNDNSCAYCWNKLVKKDLYRDVVFPTCNMHEDFALVTQLIFKAKKISFANYPLYHYNQTNVSSICKSKSRIKHKESMENKFLALRYLKDCDAIDLLGDAFFKLLVPVLYYVSMKKKSYLKKGDGWWAILRKTPFRKSSELSLIKQCLSRIIVWFYSGF